MNINPIFQNWLDGMAEKETQEFALLVMQSVPTDLKLTPSQDTAARSMFGFWTSYNYKNRGELQHAVCAFVSYMNSFK